MTKLGPDDRPGFRSVKVVDGYDRWASTYEGEPNPLIRLEERLTLALVGEVQGQRVLDLGCGTGRYCALLAKRGATVVGVDPSWGMLEQARQKIDPACHFDLYHGTLAEAGFPDEQFDLVVSALTLSHLPVLEPTLRECARVLKRGGRMVISDLHPFWPISGHDYVEFFDSSGQEYRIPEHAHLVEEYWQLFGRLGLQFEAIQEPRIEGWLIEEFPSLREHEGIPLALILRARKPLDQSSNDVNR